MPLHASKFCPQFFFTFIHRPYHPLLVVNSTLDLKICYQPREDNISFGYLNANWFGHLHDRKSITNYIFKLGSNLITWRSKKKPCTALSFTEIEYVALNNGAKKTIRLKKLLHELQIVYTIKPIVLMCDNQNAIKLSENLIFHDHTKHFVITHHIIKK